MCRHLAYLGPHRSLHSLLIAPEHSLEKQSYAPKEMETALLNADGFGVAWYTKEDEEPARFRSELPLWADRNLPDFAEHVRSHCVISNVRSATPGIGMGLANTQPFIAEGWSFSHNGYLEGFRNGTMRALQQTLSDEAFGALGGASDSEHLFALFLDGLAKCEEPEGALRYAVARLLEAAPERKALLSILATDGTQVVALRHAHLGKAPTLYHRQSDGGALFSSERLDADAWAQLPSGALWHFDGTELRQGNIEQ